MRAILFVVAAVCALQAACGHSTPAPADAGSTDAGPTDAGPADAGPMDAGPTDAGPADAGPTDAGPSCPAGSALCGAGCASLATDNANCGNCGAACPAGQACANGACAIACGGGATLCGSACKDTKIDPGNCGACGKKCDAGTMCSGGACGPRSCASGLALCGSLCVETKTDDANCGACGAPCPGGRSCSAGACVLACQAGQTPCTPGMQSDGGVPDAGAGADGTRYCADLLTGNTDCGACGAACTDNERCSAGRCCPTGQTACGGQCTDTTSDVANCGACGNTCPSAAPSCVVGTCGIAYGIDSADTDGLTFACTDPITYDTMQPPYQGGQTLGYGTPAYGFHWTDTGSGAVASVVLQLNRGESSQARRSIPFSLNGTAFPTSFATLGHPGVWGCGYSPDGIHDDLVSIPVPASALSAYVVGGANQLAIDNTPQDICGFNRNSQLGKFARVFVIYQGGK